MAILCHQRIVALHMGRSHEEKEETGATHESGGEISQLHLWVLCGAF